MGKVKDGAGPFLTIGEVARLLGVSSEMIRVHERLGRLNAVKLVTGERLFLKMDVEQFIKDHQAKVRRSRRRGKVNGQKAK